MSALERIEFVKDRDGIELSIKFAMQIRDVYRTCVLRSRKRGYDKPHHASLPEYKRGFINDYLDAKKYLKIDKSML